jgi:hypothetical protein
VREHDGFYFRFALGGGAQIGTARLEGAEATFSGGGAVVDFSIGGSARPGLALGFAVYVGVASSPSVEVRQEDRGSYLESLDGRAFSTGIIGAFVDFYPDPKGGFHVEAAVGVAPLTWEMEVADWAGESRDWSGGGFGARLGTGYEFWISEQWSLGALARLQFGHGRLKPTENDSGPELEVTTFNPGLAAVVTFH